MGWDGGWFILYLFSLLIRVEIFIFCGDYYDS